MSRYQLRTTTATTFGPAVSRTQYRYPEVDDHQRDMPVHTSVRMENVVVAREQEQQRQKQEQLSQSSRELRALDVMLEKLPNAINVTEDRNLKDLLLIRDASSDRLLFRVDRSSSAKINVTSINGPVLFSVVPDQLGLSFRAALVDWTLGFVAVGEEGFELTSLQHEDANYAVTYLSTEDIAVSRDSGLIAQMRQGSAKPDQAGFQRVDYNTSIKFASGGAVSNVEICLIMALAIAMVNKRRIYEESRYSNSMFLILCLLTPVFIGLFCFLLYLIFR